ncbi:hypothetical protein [Sciscionella marina]|uniref:ornithine cyclodeaminase family protein n=1 Tax=Sciscionella marina TaxID=508770 RepID=UPI0003782FAF
MRSIDAEELRATVSMREAVDAVREALRGHAAGEFEQPTRTALADGGFLVMTARHRPSDTVMVKTLSLNPEREPVITGTVVWAESADPRNLVADAISVTTLRTGAIAGVATDALAPRAADRLTLIGAGAQAADQFRAVHAVRPLREFTVVARDPARGEALLDRLGGELDGITTEVRSDIEDAIADTDIVCCSTSAHTPLFRAEALPERVHVNAIGSYRPSMRELPTELLGGARVVIDERAAVYEESGEILHALETGTIRETDLTELGDLLGEDRPVPENGRTVFKSVGIAVQDWAIAKLLAAKFLAGQLPGRTGTSGQR